MIIGVWAAGETKVQSPFTFIYSFKQTLGIFYFGGTMNNAAINIRT